MNKLSNKGLKRQPKHHNIRAYWEGRDEVEFFNPNWNETNWSCFACGIECIGYIDAAHIDAEKYSVKGYRRGHEDNFHLLCRPCHSASERLRGNAYWYWLHLKAITHERGLIIDVTVLDPYKLESGYSLGDGYMKKYYALTSISFLEQASRQHIQGGAFRDGRPYKEDIVFDLEGHKTGLCKNWYEDIDWDWTWNERLEYVREVLA